MKIDLHTHILPRNWPDLDKKYGYPGFVKLEHSDPCSARMMIGGRVFREINDNVWDPERRIEEMDASGVSIQVLSTVPVMFSYWAKPRDALDLCRLLNDHIAEIVRKTAEQFNAVIFVHPWDMMGTDRMPKYWLPWLVGMPAETSLAICSMIFGGVFERFPNLRVAFSHGGGGFPGTIGRIEHGFHVRPDLVAIDNKTNPRKYLANDGRPARFYVDSLVHDADALKMLIKLFGAQRIALGSDYPFPLGETKPGQLVELMKLSAEEKACLLSETAREFLGMERDSLKR